MAHRQAGHGRGRRQVAGHDRGVFGGAVPALHHLHQRRPGQPGGSGADSGPGAAPATVGAPSASPSGRFWRPRRSFISSPATKLSIFCLNGEDSPDPRAALFLRTCLWASLQEKNRRPEPAAEMIKLQDGLIPCREGPVIHRTRPRTACPRRLAPEECPFLEPGIALAQGAHEGITPRLND